MAPRQLYALFMVLACVVFVLARRYQPRSGSLLALPWWQRAALALAGFVGGAIGAKLPFALTSSHGWLSEASWLADGKTITTGLIGAYLAVELAKRLLDIRAK